MTDGASLNSGLRLDARALGELWSSFLSSFDATNAFRDWFWAMAIFAALSSSRRIKPAVAI